MRRLRPELVPVVAAVWVIVRTAAANAEQSDDELPLGAYLVFSPSGCSPADGPKCQAVTGRAPPGSPVSLKAQGLPVRDVFALIAERSGAKLAVLPTVSGTMDLSFEGAQPGVVLNAVAKHFNLMFSIDHGVYKFFPRPSTDRRKEGRIPWWATVAKRVLQVVGACALVCWCVLGYVRRKKERLRSDAFLKGRDWRMWRSLRCDTSDERKHRRRAK